jgi:PKD repeat protein
MTARALALAAFASALLSLSAATAGADVVVDQATHTRFGIVPTLARSGSGAPALAHAHAPTPFQGPACDAEGEDCTKLSYKGGPVQHGETDYLFFWAPAGHTLPREYVAGMQTWLSEIAAADYSPDNQFAVDQQYYDLSGPGATKSFVPNAIDDAGTVRDSDPYSTSVCKDEDGKGNTAVCLTDAQIVEELSSYITAHDLPTGIDVEYFVLTPENVGSCFDSGSTSCSYTSYCGYHSYAGSGSSQIVYADMPWAYKVPGCDVGEAFGAGYPNANFIDPVVSVFSHELSETMTDPNLDAWIQEGGTDSGYEIGDKCAYIYGSGGYGSLSGLSFNGSGYWNLALEGNDYLMQLEFDNRLANCALTDTDTQPTVSVSVVPSSPALATPASFTAKVEDAAGVKSIEWNFGDGTTASGASVEHTYATPGAKTLTVLATDEHGNEKRVTEHLKIAGTPPTAAFAVTTGSPTAGEPTSFDASASSDTDAAITSYSWSWGDATASSSGVAPTHFYATAGAYTVTLTVTDSTGASAQVSHEVNIAAAASGGSGGGEGGGSGGSGEGGNSGGGGSSGGGSSSGGSSGGGSSVAGGSSGASAGAGTSGASSVTGATSGAATGKSLGPTNASKTAARCKTVVRRVHGHKRKVRICAKPNPASKTKPKAKSGKRG